MTTKRFVKTHKTINWWAVLDNGKELLEDEVVELLNELHEENKELQDTIETICKDFEESHGMDIRNADWFTAW